MPQQSEYFHKGWLSVGVGATDSFLGNFWSLVRDESLETLILIPVWESATGQVNSVEGGHVNRGKVTLLLDY